MEVKASNKHDDRFNAEMYDFIDPRLLPKVECSAAAMDNYDITNLVSENIMTRALGFLAYTSVKPPVDIVFELLAPVSLYYISICAKVGNQQITGIELYGKNIRTSYVLLGSAVFHEPGVLFCNLRYYSKYKRPVNTDSDYHLSFLKQSAFRAIINSNKIKIRIFRTNKSVPCLGCVKVVGKLAKSCSKTTAETILKIMGKKDAQSIKSVAQDQSALILNEDIFDIPEEFKDALTYEIMALPMTLPSGHTVDKTTIEKCLQHDASYGRHGLDPFTGIPFCNNKKPLLNVALKCRIDMFLIQNAHKTETHQLKRTVGRTKNAIDCCEMMEKVENSEKHVKTNELLDSTSEITDLLRAFKENSNYISFFNNEQHSKMALINKCTNCDKLSNLYQLPCKDMYCRTCLLKICEDEICSKCNKSFLKKDVEKYNN